MPCEPHALSALDALGVRVTVKNGFVHAMEDFCCPGEADEVPPLVLASHRRQHSCPGHPIVTSAVLPIAAVPALAASVLRGARPAFSSMEALGVCVAVKHSFVHATSHEWPDTDDEDSDDVFALDMAARCRRDLRSCPGALGETSLASVAVEALPEDDPAPWRREQAMTLSLASCAAPMTPPPLMPTPFLAAWASSPSARVNAPAAANAYHELASMPAPPPASTPSLVAFPLPPARVAPPAMQNMHLARSQWIVSKCTLDATLEDQVGDASSEVSKASPRSMLGAASAEHPEVVGVSYDNVRLRYTQGSRLPSEGGGQGACLATTPAHYAQERVNSFSHYGVAGISECKDASVNGAAAALLATFALPVDHIARHIVSKCHFDDVTCNASPHWSQTTSTAPPCSQASSTSSPGLHAAPTASSSMQSADIKQRRRDLAQAGACILRQIRSSAPPSLAEAVDVVRRDELTATSLNAREGKSARRQRLIAALKFPSRLVAVSSELAVGYDSVAARPHAGAAVVVVASAAAAGATAKCAGRGISKGKRLWCHIYLDERKMCPSHDLVKALIGRGGKNTMEVFESTGTKVRVRGRGSGHFEMEPKAEANVHLMIALSAEHGRRECFRQAFRMVVDLASAVASRFDALCISQGRRAPEGLRLWVGGASEDSLACLGTSLGAAPLPSPAAALELAPPMPLGQRRRQRR